MKRKRMKKVLVYSLILIGLSISAFAGVGGKNDTKMSKTVTKVFAVPENGHVRIVNKYGPIQINTWNIDSVKVEITITAWGKNDKSVEKMMRRVDFDFIQSSRYLELRTVLDRSSGFFAEVWNNIGDYSKTLLSQNKLKIEYKVYLPDNLDLEIENKFGDIYFQDYSGKLRIKQSHGNIRASKFSQLDLDLSFGSADIKSIKDGVLNLKGTECFFHYIENGKITSSSSEVRISEASYLKIDSRSDRKFIIERVEDIRGTSIFSKIEIYQVKDDLRLELNYGELQMGKIASGFSSIDVTSKNTPITIEFEKEASFSLEVQGREDRIVVPGKMKKTYMNEKDNMVTIKGNIGNSPSGKVKIRSGNGDVEIIIE